MIIKYLLTITLLLPALPVTCLRAGESPSSELFPKGVSAREWATFAAGGFDEPVTGVIYRDGTMLPGMPLGGLGTGYINLDTDGCLGNCTAFGSYVPPRDLNVPFLGLNVGGKTVVLTLDELDGVESAKQIHYWGHYPVADLEYDVNVPLCIGVRAWSPFLPGDADGSNVPGAVFEVHLRNTSPAPQNGTLVFSAPGPVETESGPGPVQREQVHGAINGVTTTKVWVPPRTWAGQQFTFSYLLGAIGDEPVRYGGGLERDGAAWNAIGARLPEVDPQNASTAVALDFSVAAGETKVVRLVWAWYVPWMRAQQWDGSIKLQDASVRHYRHKYADQFGSAQEVADYLAEHHESLLRRVLAWQQVIYSEEELPGWLGESLVNILHILARCGFWETSVPRGSSAAHWFGDDGMFCMNESLVICPQQNCLPCDWIGNHPIVFFFPDLAQLTLRGLSHYQRLDGEVPFVLGHGTDMESPTHGNQAPIDGAEFVQLVDRLWQSTGDDAVLEEFYPNAKAALQFVKTLDVDGDGVPNCQGVNHLYDAWKNYGNSVHTSGLWMASLKIGQRMAQHQGDERFAKECSQWYDLASKSVEQNLWNESTGSYDVYYEPETGKRSDSILGDQLAGQWVATYHAVDDVFRPDRAQRVMETLRRLNFAATPYGLLNCVQPNAETDTTSIYTKNAITPSYTNTCPAMTMCYLNAADLRKTGIEIVRQNWHNLALRQNFSWNMPAILDGEGGVRYGDDYYHNTILWALPAAIYGQDLSKFCAPGGLVDRIKRAARDAE